MARALVVVSLLLFSSACRHFSDSSPKEEAADKRLCMDPDPNDGCPLTFADVLAAFNQDMALGVDRLPAAKAAGKPLAARIGERLSWVQRDRDRVDLQTPGPASGQQQGVTLAPYRSNGKGAVLAGVLTPAGGSQAGLVPVLLRPVLLELDAALKTANNAYLDAQLMQLMRSLAPSALAYPRVHYLPPRQTPYGSPKAVTFAAGELVEDAVADGKLLLRLEGLLSHDTGVRYAVEIGVENSASVAMTLPGPVRNKIIKGIQQDQLLRYVVDDCAGSYDQYLVSVTLQSGQIQDADVVPYDFGAAASSFKFPNYVLKSDQQRNRRRLLSGANIDLGGGYALPLPQALDSSFAQTLIKLGAALPRVKLDASGVNTSYDGPFYKRAMANLAAIKKRYPASFQNLMD